VPTGPFVPTPMAVEKMLELGEVDKDDILMTYRTAGSS
jgi:hypothetical protein